MNRRAALSSACVFGFVVLSGCLGLSEDDCPDLEISQAVSYESYPNQVDGRLVDEPPVTTILLATATSEVARFDAIGTDPKTWAEETDFEESVVVGVQLVSNTDASSPKLLGVERESDGEIRLHMCIGDKGQEAVAEPYSDLFRIRHDGSPPSTAHLSFWHDDEWESHSSQ